MSLYTSLTRHLLGPAFDLIRGTRAMRCLADLEESQWWPRERLEQLQSQRLQQLVRHAHAHVPYYREMMDAHGIRPDTVRYVSDLPKLPVLTKEHIRGNDSLLAEGFPRRELLEGHTGGSTGTPLSFYSTRESRLTRGLARSLRAMEWAGMYLGDQTIVVTKHRTRGTPSEDLLAAVSRGFERKDFVDCSRFTESSLPLVIERIARRRPRVLQGYASAICIIAEFIRSSSIQPPEVGAIVVGGEQLFDEQRILLRTVFGKEPFSKYSSFENFDIAMECESHSGMHIAAEDLVVEIVDDEGKPVEAGHQGHLLVTNLHEYGMPLIRYRTDDESSFVAGVCSCGRELPLISGVVGKTGNTIHTPSGKRISPLALGASGLAPLGIRQFQFVQEELDHVVVRVVPGDSLSPTDVSDMSARVVAHFGRVLGDEVRIDVVVVNHIEPTSAGKHLFLISKVGAAPCPASLPYQILPRIIATAQRCRLRGIEQ